MRPKNSELSEHRVGRLAASWNPATGLRLTVDGVPIVRQSTLYLVKRGWQGTLFGQPSVAWQTDGWSANHTATITARNEAAVAIYRLTLTDTVFKVTLTLRQLSREPADWEYAAAYLTGYLVTTQPPAIGRTQTQNRLTERRFPTPLGVVSLSYTGDAEAPNLFDARSDPQGWAQTFPTLWWGIGSPAPMFPIGGTRTVTFTFAIGPRPTTTPGQLPAPPKRAIRAQSEAYLPPMPPVPQIIPTPKEADYRGDSFRLLPGAVIFHDGAHTTAATLLAEGITARTGITLNLKREGVGLRVGRGGEPAPPQKAEGYAIAVDTGGARAQGYDANGALWAAQTLLQLVAADARGILLRAARIQDWPTLSFRGVHLFHGQTAPEFHKKLIGRIFSPFKLNTLVLQVEQVRWKHDPAVAPDWAGTPERLREEIAFARSKGLTCYPLIQGYGHMEWLFNKPANQGYAEDPQTPYAVNFTNPTAIRYLEGFFDEADALFGASAFHIGLDEVTMRGRFPYRSSGRSFVDLFTTGATHWRDFFARRGKQTWMWADMTLHPSEVAPCFGTAPTAEVARAVRAKLPKDIVLFDWQYSALDSYPSLRKLKEAGFKKVVAATWANPSNISGFARAAAEAGALGAVQTTWCGYESKEIILDTAERKQFVAMVLAAEAFWNGGVKSTWNPDAVFAQAWAGHDPARLRPSRGFTLGANLQRMADGILYDLSQPVTLSGPWETQTFPSAVTVTLGGQRARELVVLVSTTHRTDPGTQIGTLKVALASGEVREVPLVYGQNIAASTDPNACPSAPRVGDARRLTVSLGAKAVSLRELSLESRNTEAAPILHAVTGLQ
ncbi:MAG: beta-N-acetylhexosaminidase [Armatimonas sp.]